MIRVKIRRYQVIKLILTCFVVVQENIKPSVLMHRPHKLGLYFEDIWLYIFLYNTKTVSMRIVLKVSLLVSYFLNAEIINLVTNTPADMFLDI